MYVIPILCGAWALPPKSLLQNRCFSAPLTALHATGSSVVDVAEKNMEGRHVGLDFYDLLIEVERDLTGVTQYRQIFTLPYQLFTPFLGLEVLKLRGWIAAHWNGGGDTYEDHRCDRFTVVLRVRSG
jgi:hypothetical protein